MSIWNKINPFQRKNFNLGLLSNHVFKIIQGKKVFFQVSDNTRKELWLLEKYNDLSELAAPINKIADFASIVTIEPYDLSGKLIKNKEIDRILKNPNSEQIWPEFYKKHIIYRLLFGNSYVNAYGYTSPLMSFELKLLPPQYTEIKLKDKKDFRNLEIDRYLIKIPTFDAIEITEIDSVLHIRETNPNFSEVADLYGRSKLLSCIKNLMSLDAGYQAKVGLYQHGPRIIITGKSQGEFASANLQSNETVKELQERINNEYGLQDSQFQVMITDIPLDVHQASMDIGQLKINETNISDFQAICRALDIDSRVLSDVSSSTFSNVEMAIDAFLNGSFKTLIENDLLQWSSFFSYLFRMPIVLKANYENIPAIVNAENENNDKLQDMTYAGLLTRNEFFERTNDRIVNNPEFNEYFTFFNGYWIPITDKPQQNGTTENI